MADIEAILETAVYHPVDVARLLRRSPATIERMDLPWSYSGNRSRQILGKTLIKEIEKRAR